MDFLLLFSTGCVSGSTNTATSIKSPIPTSNQNIECHVYHTSKCPANIGPAIGAIAITMANVDNILAASVRPYKSRIIARDSIGPTQAPNA